MHNFTFDVYLYAVQTVRIFYIAMSKAMSRPNCLSFPGSNSRAKGALFKYKNVLYREIVGLYSGLKKHDARSSDHVLNMSLVV